ncbi:MAG: hypothetical protein HY736_00670, partial [Verrucomicrobia bacterium]|nr:hypothetical protein [Verrucomicrobiota bacterium]
YRPFASKDADIYGTRALAQILAQRAGWQCHLARVFPSSLWLSGAPALQPVVARLKAHGLAPPADSSSPESSPD